jgi:hypothetical protein
MRLNSIPQKLFHTAVTQREFCRAFMASGNACWAFAQYSKRTLIKKDHSARLIHDLGEIEAGVTFLNAVKGPCP